MRVISGTLGGRKFNPPNNIPTRPTTDFAKTALFNILQNNFSFDEINFLDLFSGTGSISYEMASRGCERIISVEKDARCHEFISRMKREWNLPIDVYKMDVFQFMNKCSEKFDVIFAGPPYPLENIPQLPEIVLEEKKLLKPGGWFILETSPDHSFETNSHFFRVKNYGQTHFHFFSAEKVDSTVQNISE